MNIPRPRPPVFLVGAPRSGTTWLQAMLAAHPGIASPPETDLYNRYLAPWADLWALQAQRQANDHGGRPNKGLPAVLTSDELDEQLRAVARAVHAAVLRAKPSAELVVEKHPSYSVHLPLILRLHPEAPVIHLVRDGRDVAASLVRASATWARHWAPRRIGAAAARWERNVRGARAARELTDRYLELRYESLLADGAAELRRALDFCGVSSGDADAIVEDHRLDRMRDTGAAASSVVVPTEQHFGRHAEPRGFVGAGRAGAWREAWSPADRHEFAQVAGPLLRELGYEPDDAWVDCPPAQAALRDVRVGAGVGLAAGRARLGRALRRAAGGGR